MLYFLTSSPHAPGQSVLNPANGFAAELKQALPKPVRALFITSMPDDPDFTAQVSASTRALFAASGIEFSAYEVLDRSGTDRVAEFVDQAELIVLSGGPTPMENRFFADLGLKALIDGFDGVLVGISAGSMNSAQVVYAQPEEPGEAIDPDFEKFLPGLGLTQMQIIPHYQVIKDSILDGKRLFEEVTYPDSMGHCFHAFPDGTYLFGIRGGCEELRGEAYTIKNGILTQISREGEVLKNR